MRPDQILAAAQVRILDLAEAECGYCGYADYACICDQLCFYRMRPDLAPCLEPKDEQSDPVCKYHREDYLADEALDIFGSIR